MTREQAIQRRNARLNKSRRQTITLLTDEEVRELVRLQERRSH